MSDALKPITRPDVIVPDTGPLIHLAQANALHLLHEVGGRVVVAEMVAFEAIRDPDKPGARDIAAWIKAGQGPGANAPVLVAETEIGRLFQKALQVDPDTRALPTCLRRPATVGVTHEDPDNSGSPEGLSFPA